MDSCLRVCWLFGSDSDRLGAHFGAIDMDMDRVLLVYCSMYRVVEETARSFRTTTVFCSSLYSVVRTRYR